MPAKRKSRSTTRSAGAVARSDRQGAESAESAVPPGDNVPARPEASAPKAGPVARGGARFAGVGRGRGAPAARRYAFRRS